MNQFETKYLLLDCDGVWANIDGGFFKEYTGRTHKILSVSGQTPPLQEYRAFMKQFEMIYQRGQLTATEFWLSVTERFNASRNCINECMDTFEDCFKPDMDTLRLVQSMKMNGYTRTGVLSNTYDVIATKIRETGKDIFDDFFLSSDPELQLRKDSTELFQLVLAKLQQKGVEASEVVFFDDKPENVAVAQQVFQESLVYKGRKQLIKTILTVNSV